MRFITYLRLSLPRLHNVVAKCDLKLFIKQKLTPSRFLFQQLI